MEEIERLNIALHDFNKAMKKRLEDKALNAHFTGWDNIPMLGLVWKIFDRVVYMIRNPGALSKKWCVDIANFAMFLHYRL